ncbi:NADH-quinone oxidoreductase subunit C/D [Gammaproteobacteria bacterium]|nr:NADH-quinone oxidoreductase subunit C/D [Gammaproteobacteria bacterium]
MSTASTSLQQSMTETPAVITELYLKYGESSFVRQNTAEGMPTLWLGREKLLEVLKFLRDDYRPRFEMLLDVTAIDERLRVHRDGQPESDFTVVYQLLSYSGNCDIRLKIALKETDLTIPTIISLWPAANWHERECWDMFGVVFEGHPNLSRIYTPPTWVGHPLRKDHPARATEMDPYRLDDDIVDTEQEAMKFNPEEWGLERKSDTSEFMFLNFGPNHPAAHGVIRFALQLDGEYVMDVVPDVGYHHRGAEKMGERQTWHTYIPYTDRIDYLGGVMNNLPYVMAVEKMAGIEVPDRVKVIRVMLAEFFRICSHLLFFGTWAVDLGQLSPLFYAFVDREKAFNIIESITGGRMHPSWFRIGGVAQDLPNGWEVRVREFVDMFPKKLLEYNKMVMANTVIKQRTVGVGKMNTQDAYDWGMTGPALRATGLEWDYRKDRPYSGYENFEFEVPIGVNGDCYDRAAIRVEEMRQSCEIIRQCLENMPSGPYKSDHPLTTPPLKEDSKQDIETLINHFLSVSWGPVMEPSEVSMAIEATKGINSYYLINDGGSGAYRTRIRTPSFIHIQAIPFLSRGLMLADFTAVVATTDFVMADVDK